MELILCMFHYVKFIILCFCFSVFSPSRCSWNFGTRITVHFTRIHINQSQFDRERGCDKHYEIFRETHVIMELILCMFHYVKFIILCFCFFLLSPSRCSWNFGTTPHSSHAYTCAAFSMQFFSVFALCVCVCALAS